MSRTPSPSCRDFPTARSAGRRFGRICRTRPRCRNSSSSMSAWATATSPRTMPIPPPNAPISSKRSGGDLSVQSTTLVAFDFSSLVVLEHLRRRLERAERGEPAGGPDIRGVFIFNGGLFTDGHSHPWYTTPILRRLPNRARRGLGRSFTLFKMMAGVMWSKGYQVTDAEVRELYNAMDRHDGLFYLAAAAGFVADHKAQGDRLDFGRLFEAYRDQFPFLVGGSDEDPFEHRQVDLAQERLGKLGLQIERLPGGHLTTNEQPEALAALIANFERGLARMQPAPGN